jgi:hypothetical protein
MKNQDERQCEHCWHTRQEALLMVIPDGHVAQVCCKCRARRTIHKDHGRGMQVR